MLLSLTKEEGEKKAIMTFMRDSVKFTINQLSDKEIDYYIKNINSRKNLSNRIRDYILLSLGNKNNTTATALLIKLYSEFIRRVVMHTYLNYEMPFNSNSLEEVVTDTISKLWKINNTYDPKRGTFATWLAKIIQNNIKHDRLIRNRIPLISLDKTSDNIDSDKIENFIYHQESNQLFTSPDIIFAMNYYAEYVFLEIFKDPVSYPWQLICYLLNIIGYKPRQIVNKFSKITLSQISIFVKEDFKKNINRFEPRFIDKSFEPLESEMEITFSSDYFSFFYNENLKIHYGKRTGDIELENFYGKNPSKSISDWASKVRQKLITKFAE
jgi:hypothetical protein